jgi:hypothetical protein
MGRLLFVSGEIFLTKRAIQAFERITLITVITSFNTVLATGGKWVTTQKLNCPRRRFKKVRGEYRKTQRIAFEA